MMLMSITHLRSTKNKGEEIVQLTDDGITMHKTMTSIDTTLTMKRKGERLPAVGEATAAIKMSKSIGMCREGVYLNTMAPVDIIIAPEEMAEAEMTYQIQPLIRNTIITTNNEVDTNLTPRAIITMVMRITMQIQTATVSEVAPIIEPVAVATAEVATHHTPPLPTNKTMRAAVEAITTKAESMQLHTKSTARNSISSNENSIRKLLCSNNLDMATNQVINRKGDLISIQTTTTSIIKRQAIMTISAVKGSSTTAVQRTTETTKLQRSKSYLIITRRNRDKKKRQEWMKKNMSHHRSNSNITTNKKSLIGKMNSSLQPIKLVTTNGKMERLKKVLVAAKLTTKLTIVSERIKPFQ